MTNQFYSDIFKHSGSSYHRAMQKFPTAREEEFRVTVEQLNLDNTKIVLDVPAGGGYLQNYLPNSIKYIARDFSTGFVNPTIIKGCSETDLDVAQSSVDAIVCLASLHHVENQLGFFEAAKNALRPSGVLLIGDVIEGSAQDAFLNKFVNDWNSLGHKGSFLNESRLKNKLTALGFEATYSAKHFNWNFKTIFDAREYTKLLFNLDKKPPEKKIDQAFMELGVNQSESSFHLNWTLGFFQCLKI